MPVWLARLAAGRIAVEMATAPMHTFNHKARRELGWAPRYSTIDEGLPAVVEAWRGEGTVSMRAAA